MQADQIISTEPGIYSHYRSLESKMTMEMKVMTKYVTLGSSRKSLNEL